MAFTLTLVVLIIYELLTESNSVELSRKYLMDGERLKAFQGVHENNEHYQRRINFQVHLVDKHKTTALNKDHNLITSADNDNGCVSKASELPDYIL